jgi:hypothetical protein
MRGVALHSFWCTLVVVTHLGAFGWWVDVSYELEALPFVACTDAWFGAWSFK